MDSHSKRVKFQEYLQRGFLNVTNKVFGKERQDEKRLWNNFMVNERAGQTVCIHCWKEFSLKRYAHNDKRLFFQTYPGRSDTVNFFLGGGQIKILQIKHCSLKKTSQSQILHGLFEMANTAQKKQCQNPLFRAPLDVTESISERICGSFTGLDN